MSREYYYQDDVPEYLPVPLHVDMLTAVIKRGPFKGNRFLATDELCFLARVFAVRGPLAGVDLANLVLTTYTSCIVMSDAVEELAGATSAVENEVGERIMLAARRCVCGSRRHKPAPEPPGATYIDEVTAVVSHGSWKGTHALTKEELGKLSVFFNSRRQLPVSDQCNLFFTAFVLRLAFSMAVCELAEATRQNETACAQRLMLAAIEGISTSH